VEAEIQTDHPDQEALLAPATANRLNPAASNTSIGLVTESASG
jgi:hypothetical protein